MKRHFTSTAFVINGNHQVLLLNHKRLGRWMPPGGHVDPDETPEETARRECKEETGLDVEILGEHMEDMFTDNPHEGRMLKKPIALLLENIPPFDGAQGKAKEPAHQHMDFVYRATLKDERQTVTLAEEEGSDIRWFTRKEIEALDERKEIFANVKHYVLSILNGNTASSA